LDSLHSDLDALVRRIEKDSPDTILETLKELIARLEKVAEISE
jgi:hypothetical protein